MALGHAERWHTACIGTGMSANSSKRESSGHNLFLAAARRGSHDAFGALVSPHASNLRRLARRFTRNAEDAEDVCQQSMLKAFTKLHRFAASKEAATAEFRSWLAKITANSALDFLRRRRGARLVRLEECDHLQQPDRDGWGENPEASYARRERARMILEAVAALPAALRTVCMLRDFEELSTKEVAERLGLTAIAVRVRLFRAHCELRKRLGAGAHHGHPERKPSNKPTSGTLQRQSSGVSGCACED